MKCSECEYKVYEPSKGGINRYYCSHPEVTKGVGSRMICRTERHSTMLKIKTSPKWCPLKQVCRVCSCSWYNACPGGCYWVETDLCSKCAGI
ncbi:MAG: hypothetical protein ACYDG2_01365 [Ruminiclostridium sp.]